MFDLAAISSALAAEGLGDWRALVEPLVAERLADATHGDLADWRDAVDSLPCVAPQPPELHADAVGAPSVVLDEHARAAARTALLRLRPWRKGPFVIDSIRIDAEWRSHLKWERVAGAMSPLQNRLVLDVGCGNGY